MPTPPCTAASSIWGSTLRSGSLFAQVKTGRFLWIVSAVVVDELVDAPERVRQVDEEHLPRAGFIGISVDAVRLRDPCLKASIGTSKWATDAMHIALASVEHCRCIVRWNFRHMVHFDEIPLHHGIDPINEFESISINTPGEVIAYET